MAADVRLGAGLSLLAYGARASMGHLSVPSFGRMAITNVMPALLSNTPTTLDASMRTPLAPGRWTKFTAAAAAASSVLVQDGDLHLGDLPHGNVSCSSEGFESVSTCINESGESYRTPRHHACALNASQSDGMETGVFAIRYSNAGFLGASGEIEGYATERPLELELGYQAPLGFWNPLGLSADSRAKTRSEAGH